jgi:pyruvate/2-oxoglutarate dehydrogenase complex dihydrolipoamide dehydrogenase (E3) component
MNRVQNKISKIAPHDSIERYTDLGVHCISGEAKIIGPWEIEVNGKVLTTKNIILATGASPLLPPIPGLREATYVTSDTIWSINELPKKLVVVGGGPIGVELAQAFRRLGSEVTIVEMAPRILGKEDADISSIVIEKLVYEGIVIYTNHKAAQFIKKDSKEFLIAHCEDQEIELEFDYCLMALGRRANTKIPGLDKLALTLSRSGTFDHDERMRTRYPNIFVVGDCAGPYQFTHTAAHQAWYASVNALFAPFVSFKVDYRVVPWCTFTDPEIGRVGISEEEAKEKGIDYEVVRYDISDLDRAIAEDEDFGVIKVILAKGSDQILGASIVSTRASELLAEMTLAMKYKVGLNKILGTIHAYPTFSEAIKYTAGEWKKSHRPELILRFLKKIHSWRRG